MTGDLVTRAAAAWWSWFPAMALQAAVLVLLLLALERLLAARLGAGFRQALWALAGAKLLVSPALPSPFASARPLVPEVPAGAGPAPPSALLPALWLAALVVLGIFLVTREARRRSRLLAGVRPAGEADLAVLRRAAARVGRRRVPPLLVGPSIPSPAVIGLLRPRILLPARMPVGRNGLEHVLLHELVHLRRRDLPRQAAWAVLALVYWFHPLVWIARRRAGAAREFACDAAVARLLGPERRAYGRTLLAAALAPAAAAPAGLSLLSPGPLVAARVRALETAGRAPRLRTALTLAVVAALAGTVLPMGRPRGSPSPGDPEVEAARSSVRYGIENPERAGSLMLRNAVLRLHAASERSRGDSP